MRRLADDIAAARWLADVAERLDPATVCQLEGYAALHGMAPLEVVQQLIVTCRRAPRCGSLT
jgi:hypothetical protein